MPATTELPCRIETPKGSALWAGPTQQAEVYPADCCYFPDTLGRGGGRPLEAMVCVSAPGSPGGTVAARPVALVHRCAHAEPEIEVVVCVAADDGECRSIETASDLPAHLRDEIERFLARHPVDEPTPTIVWGSRDEALTAIDDAAARWAATVNGRG